MYQYLLKLITRAFLAITVCPYVWAATNVNSESTTQCPQLITSQQTVNDVPNSFQAIDLRLGSSRLVSVGFYADDPKLRESLVPIEDRNEIAIWDFGQRSKGKDIWLVCSYSDTRIELATKIAASAKRCQVNYKPTNKRFVLKQYQIQKIECK